MDVTEYSQYYKNLFSHFDRENSFEHNLKKQKVNEYLLEIEHQTYNCQWAEIDVEYIIKNLECKKACGFDNIPNEMLKYGLCENLISVLTCFFNKILSTGFVPADFNVSIVSPIPKKGVMTGPDDSRPISVSSVFSRIFESLMLTKMEVITQIHPNQFG